MLRKWFTPPEEIAPQTAPVRSGPADSLKDQQYRVEEPAPRAISAPPAAPAAPSNGTSGGRYSSFEQIYQTVINKLPRIPYNIMKVAEMVNSPHLASMSADAKRCSLLMALEAAGVAIEDVLQDAVLRQKAISDYEEAQRSRVKNFEQTKSEENAKIQAELEKATKAHMARIQGNLDEIAREQEAFRAWQKSKNQECERLTAAAGYCVPQGSAIGVSSLASVLERATLPQ